MKALARCQVKPEWLQADGSRPCPQPVATSALGGASGGWEHREGSEVRGVALRVLEGEGPAGVFQLLLQAQACPPSCPFPQGSRGSGWGERAPPKGMGLPPGPEVSGSVLKGQRLCPQRSTVTSSKVSSYILKGQQLCPQRSADILGAIVYVFKGQWLCSKVRLTPVKVSGSVATLGPHWRRQGLTSRPRDLPPAEVICPGGTRCLPPCRGHSRGLPQGLALRTEPQPSTQALGT